jgi:hypothetical protein
MKGIHWLLVFVPIAIAADVLRANPAIVFVTSALGVIPLAGLLGEATEALEVSFISFWGNPCFCPAWPAVETVPTLARSAFADPRTVHTGGLGCRCSDLSRPVRAWRAWQILYPKNF